MGLEATTRNGLFSITPQKNIKQIWLQAVWNKTQNNIQRVKKEKDADKNNKRTTQNITHFLIKSHRHTVKKEKKNGNGLLLPGYWCWNVGKSTNTPAPVAETGYAENERGDAVGEPPAQHRCGDWFGPPFCKHSQSVMSKQGLFKTMTRLFSFSFHLSLRNQTKEHRSERP